MIRNEAYIKGLLTKYFNALTTIEEEDILSKYFTENVIPDSLMAEKEMFLALYKPNFIPIINVEHELSVAIQSVQKKQKRIRGRVVKLLTSFAAAASVAIIIGLSWLITYQADDAVFADTFDDPHLALQETQRVLALVGAKINKVQDELVPLDNINLPSRALAPFTELNKSMDHLNNIKALEKPKEIPFFKLIFEKYTTTNE